MPRIKAAKKALRASRKRYLINSDIKKKLKDTVKKANEKNIHVAFSLIDKAAKKNVIHANKAARLKSRLAKKIGSTPKTQKTAAKPIKSAKRKTATKKK